MRRFFLRFFAFVGLGFTLAGLVLLILVVRAVSPEPLPRAAVVELDLERGLVEDVPDDPFLLALDRRRLSVRDVVEGLERAAEDDRVRGLMVRVGSGALGLAVVEELRSAVEEFRESGKPAVLFSETFGELGPGLGGYYLATAFDEIVLQPSGDIGLAGMAIEIPFFQGTLEWAGIRAQGDQREEYKGVLDIFTQDGLEEPAREAFSHLLDGLFQEVVNAVAETRGLEESEVRTLLTQGPFLAQEAQELELVDRLAYRDEVKDDLRDRLGEEVSFVSFRSYRDRADAVWDGGDRVALIYGTGPVHRGESGLDPFMGGGGSMGSETVGRAFREAIDDDDVRAIVFRVDSPGGSYVGSDVIHREVIRAREAGKPVVVSMSNVATSGGYLVSASADRIIAQPSTLTGSIGVAAGKAVLEEMWEKLRVSWDGVDVGGNSGMWSSTRPFDEEEWARVETILDTIYEEFRRKVEVGRGMDSDAVREAARGRVWTGRQAMDLGLVDGLGGLSAALAAVREELELDPGASLDVRRYPEPRPLLQLLMEGGASPAASRGFDAILGGRGELWPTVGGGAALLNRLLERGVATGGRLFPAG